MYEQLQAALHYQFKNPSLLRNALTHSSYANENRNLKLPCNERLEFLGDSVLGFVVAEYLYRSFPDRPEGEMTRMRADMVCEATLAAAAEVIGIGNELLLGHGEAQNGGRRRASILADAMESVIAAAYLDGGFGAAHSIIERFILCSVPKQQLRNVDYKTMLQELVQQKKDQQLSYHLIGESGPDHNKSFAVEVHLNGKTVGTGEGSSKKRAEQAAAKAAVERLFPEE
ncbi:MAG: ribonuclease III [Ruminococcaceae bacterium]|nr:ribonuclease III [Oscillospiraceae bacterium]